MRKFYSNRPTIALSDSVFNHRQFGNMLVLSATYMSYLWELVNHKDLNRLLMRTINFLFKSRNISPSLSMDAKILAGIYKKIFHGSPNLSFTE
jgi:hypothetical protein